MTLNFSRNASSNINDSGYYLGKETVPSSWPEVVLIFYMVITAILAIGGNGIIILVEARNLCKTSTDWLVTSMAANDILFALVNIPVHVMFHSGSWANIGSDAGCAIHTFVEKVTVFSSTLLLCAVAVDRYLKTCRPFSQLFTADRAFRACVAIIIVSCISVSPGLEVMHFEKNTFCEQKSSFIVRVLHVLYMSIFIAMFSIVGFCYARVAFTIKHRLMRKTNSAQPLPPGPTNSSTTNSKKTLKGIPHFRCWNRVSPATEESMLREQMKESIRRSTSDAVAIGKSKQDASCEMKNTTAAGSSDLRRSTFINTYAAHPKAKINNRARPEIDIRKDRTTKIMFAVTLVFIFSWVPTWSVFVYYALGGYRDPTRQNVILLFGEKLYMVNTFMNPFFYISMSSTFQRRTQIVLRSLTNCKKWRAH